MKKILLLFSLITLVGCSQFSARKDQSQHITFNNSISRGKYNFNLISLEYPNNYNGKIDFLKNLNNSLTNLNSVQKNNLNLLITKEMDTDFSSLIETGWFDKEIIGMKIVEDLSTEEKAFLNDFSIEVPENAGITQKLLNRQYFLLLKLTDNESLYNSSYLYTELDKSLLMEDILLSRKSIVDNINSIKKNFVYSDWTENDKKAVYIKNANQDINSLEDKSIIFKNSDVNSGFKVFPNSLVLFLGNSHKYLSTDDYELTSNLVLVKSFDELKNLTNDSNSVSNLLSWKRKDWTKNDTTESLENRFSTWEAK
ncbi:MAG: hypothetical protein ACRCVB_05430 [Cetobacterium sp.]|uniref:hypothetical protein n=1 Tax=Cetobacterium sp. ZOR0034 TaxID=1339239 RepID=UPI0006482019|nr:hypothetical protein [Cetobacterium sp. ZOR0034]